MRQKIRTRMRRARSAIARRVNRSSHACSGFAAATWNVYHGTKLDELRPILRDLRRDGVTLFLIQEGQRNGLLGLLEAHGLVGVRGGPESLVAYDPQKWREKKRRIVQLATSTYYRVTGRRVPLMYSPMVKLQCLGCGRKVKALSYHTPSAVQRGGKPNRGAARRLRVTESAMRLFRRLARHTKGRVALLFGGDDNFDERLGHWHELTQPFTGLQVVQAPTGTHGNGARRIDDFRVRGLHVGEGYTTPGGGDHRVHVRFFNWKGSKR